MAKMIPLTTSNAATTNNNAASAQVLQLNNAQLQKVQKVVAELSDVLAAKNDRDLEQLSLGAEALYFFVGMLELFGFIDRDCAQTLQNSLGDAP